MQKDKNDSLEKQEQHTSAADLFVDGGHKTEGLWVNNYIHSLTKKASLIEIPPPHAHFNYNTHVKRLLLLVP